MNISELKNIVKINPGLSPDEISTLGVQLARTPPHEYLELLQAADGFSLANGLVVYSSEEISERNDTFEVQRYAPDYLAIGDDSGGVSVLIRFDGKGVFVVDQGSMDPDDMQQIALSLTEWISSGCPVIP